MENDENEDVEGEKYSFSFRLAKQNDENEFYLATEETTS